MKKKIEYIEINFFNKADKKPFASFVNKYKNPKPFQKKKDINFGSNIFTKSDSFLQNIKKEKLKKPVLRVFLKTSLIKRKSFFMKKKLKPAFLKNIYLQKRKLLLLRNLIKFLSKISFKPILYRNEISVSIKNFYKKKCISIKTKTFIKKKFLKNLTVETPKILKSLFKKKSISYSKFDSTLSLLLKNKQNILLNLIKNIYMLSLNKFQMYSFNKIVFNKILNKKLQLKYTKRYKYFIRKYATIFIKKKHLRNLKFSNKILRQQSLHQKVKIIKNNLVRKGLFYYLNYDTRGKKFRSILKNNVKYSSPCFNLKKTQFFIKFNNPILNILKNQVTNRFIKKVFIKFFYMKYVKTRFRYLKNIWQFKKPKNISTSLLKKAMQSNYSNAYSKKFSLFSKNLVGFRKAVHFGEIRSIKYRILSNISFEKRKLLLQRYITGYPWYRRKFVFKFLKSNNIIINNTKTRLSYFFPWKKYFHSGFMLRRFKYGIRNNRRLLWKKNWKKMKLNKKQYFAKRFLYYNLSKNNFKRQDSFRLLHNFRTIFLKYSYRAPKLSLSLFKDLKNHSFIHNTGNNFIERFLWNLERSINILVYRAKYIPHIKIANHLIRYGFIMLNNKIMSNPHTQANILDIIRICKVKYFKRIFLTQFINLYGIRRYQSIPSFIETNKRILSLAVHRKPKIKDFVKKKIKVVFGPDKSFYSSIPIISALF
jgi:hypothetical protein